MSARPRGSPRATAPLALALAVAVTTSITTAPATAQTPAATDRLTTIEGEELAGRVDGLDGDAIVLQLASGESRRVALDAVDRIDLANAGGAPVVESTVDRLWLRSGQVLSARFVRARPAPSGGVFEMHGGQMCEVPWRFVQAVRFAPGDAPADEGFAARIAQPLDDLDLLWASGDGGALVRLSVQVLVVTDDHVTARFQGAERTMPLARVHGIVFARGSGAAPDAQPNPRAVLELTSGRALEGKLQTFDGERAVLRFDEGFALSLPRPQIAAVRVRSDKLVYVTQLKAEVEQVPAFDRTWPPLVDEGPGGGPILVRGKPHRRGLVLVPRTRMTYALDGRYDVFEATIAQEDRAGDRADAVFRLLADGSAVFDSGSVTPATEPQILRIPVKGVARLTLEADFGQAFDLGDLCAFASARLRRE